MRKEEKDFVKVALPIVVIYITISYLLIKYALGWLFDFEGNIFLDVVHMILMLLMIGWVLLGILVVWLTVGAINIIDAYLLAPKDIHILRRGECPLCREKDSITTKTRNVPTIFGSDHKLHQHYVFCEHCQREVKIDEIFCPKCFGFAQPWKYHNQPKRQNQPDAESHLVEASGKECTFCGHIEITKKVFA